MQVEREIKFSLTPEAARRVARQVRPAGPWRRRMVSNAYYDTANERLRRAGVALRLRRDGKRRLQTLKVESAAAGLSTRAEWEMPAPRGRLDVARFRARRSWPQPGWTSRASRARLRPRFETRFVAPLGAGDRRRRDARGDLGRSRLRRGRRAARADQRRSSSSSRPATPHRCCATPPRSRSRSGSRSSSKARPSAAIAWSPARRFRRRANGAGRGSASSRRRARRSARSSPRR